MQFYITSVVPLTIVLALHSLDLIKNNRETKFEIDIFSSSPTLKPFGIVDINNISFGIQ